MILEEGKIVWTCEATFEAGYDYFLSRPRQVKLRLEKGNHSLEPVWYAHGFNHETGEIDTDSNATTFATEHTCFENKKDADDRYISYLKGNIEGLQEELRDFTSNQGCT